MITDTEMKRACEFFDHIQSIGLTEHIICVAERGDQEERLHLQTMMSGDWSMRKCNTVEFKKIVDKQKIFSRPYHLKVQMHKLDESRTMHSLCGCGATTKPEVRHLVRNIVRNIVKRFAATQSRTRILTRMAGV